MRASNILSFSVILYLKGFLLLMGSVLAVPQDTTQSGSVGNSPVVKEISLAEAYELFNNKSALFVDARQPFFFERAHIENSISVHFRKADTLGVVKTLDKRQTLVVYCGGPDCDQAHRLAKTLMLKGFMSICIFTGGMDEWRAAKYPLTETEFKHK
jgi:rhodanese-related sulfurtransferase